MKKIIFLTVPFLALLLLNGCKKSTNDTVITYKGTIKEEIDANPDYSLFKIALIKAGLSPSLGVPPPPYITVFAPTNQAMQNVGIKDTQNVTGSYLRKVLDYLIIVGKISPSDSSKSLLSQRVLDSGDSVFIIKSGSDYLLNGLGKITPSGKTFTNGLLYIIDKVPLPPFGNILGTLSNDSTLTYIFAAIFKLADADINKLINNSSSTLFAPTNQAFISAGLDSTTLVNLPSVTLKNLLLYHFTIGRKFTTDLQSGSLVMANGETTTLSVGSQITIKGTANTTPSNIIRSNQIANPGIIQIIDKVLQP